MDTHAAVQVPTKQATITQQVYKVVYKPIEQRLSVETRAHLRSCGGVGAGSYLEGPPDEGSELPDEFWETATRYRIGMTWPAHDVRPDEMNATLTCGHCTKAGKICGARLDQWASHAVHCHNGPCTNNRHNAVARALGTLLKDLTEGKADFEQRLPQLDYMDNEGKTVEARMDMVHEHPQLGRLWVDVA
eukprot:15465661-Alexandrium_andersonii.AAC.1